MKISPVVFRVLIVLLVDIFFLLSCERDTLRDGSDGSFQFSTDTVAFDTIFSNQGTPTYKLIIRNTNNFRISFDSIFLAKRGINGFIVNIDGRSAISVKNICIDARDSIYVFVQSFPSENQESNVILLKDSLMFVSGEYRADVKLIAVAQNVTSFRDVTISTQNWSNEKPYLIFGTLTVDSGNTLTIDGGARIYFHRNAKMIVNGRLIVNGSWQYPVNFKSDRLEKDYDTIPGQWGGVFLRGDKEEHQINYAILRNGTNGITVGAPEGKKMVHLNIANTKCLNMGYSALMAYHAVVNAQNCLLGNSGNTVCSLLDGGNYEFVHCTFGNYGAKNITSEYDSKALVLSNYTEYLDNEEKLVVQMDDLTGAVFGNCIFYGFVNDDISLDYKIEKLFSYKFENCILKVSSSSALKSDSNMVNCKFSEDPKFIDPYRENYLLDTLSSAKDAGKPEYGQLVPLDLDNNSRISDSKPDAGVYERIEK
jgi:hypothetical protein